MIQLKSNFYRHICIGMLSSVLASSAIAVELEDESENSIFHEVKGNLSLDNFYTSLGLYNGRYSTTIPVVSLPGNASLEVGVYLQSFPDSKYTTPEPYGLPMITGVLPCGYDEPVWRSWLEDLYDSDFTDINDSTSTTYTGQSGSGAPHAGMYLHIPGKSPERMGNGGNYNTEAYTLNNYYYECTDDYPGEEGSPGNAPDFSMTITVYTPEGNKYIFDQMAFDYGPDAVEFGEGVLYASYIEDPFGNRVNYIQDEGIVSEISASDGRKITFEYSGDNDSDSSKVTISANGRQWEWQGRWTEPESSSLISDWGAQRSLILPDNTSWTFDATDNVGLNPVGACSNQSGSTVIKNPQGAELSLTLENIVVFAAYRSGSVTNLPPKSEYNCKDFWNLVYANQLRRKSEHGAVTEISISAPGVSSPYVWDIEYDEGWGRTVPENPSFALARTVTKPDGSSIKYQFESHSAAPLITNVISTEVLDASNNVLASYYPSFTLSRQVLDVHGDDTGATSGGLAQKEHQTLLSSSVTTIGSDVFTTTYNYSETNDWDKRNIPTQIKRTSVHGDTTRKVNFTYRNLTLDNEGVYRIGLPKTTKHNDKLFVTNTYYDNGSLKTTKQFNSTADTSHTYYASGLLETTTNPVGRVDEYSQYKRGIPEITVMAKGTDDEITLLKEVDNNGWVTSETDAMGYKVNIEHDDVGRVEKVTYPDRDRATENTVYSNLGSGMKVKVTIGNSEITTTYDGLSRSTLTQHKDLSGKALTIYERFEYDAFGRTTFASWPSNSSAATQGVDTSYDALGRVKTITENVTPYAETSFEYLSGDRVKSTDPQGNNVTTTYAGYYPLSTVAPIKYEHPLGITTTIERNIWGQQSSVTQSGSWNGSAISETQNFYYNDMLELCGHYTPETKHTRYAYDAAGRMKTYQAGAETSGNSCPTPTGSNLVTLTYDDLDRLKLTDYADSGTLDIDRTYDLNSNLKTLSSDAVVHTYQYDNLDQLEVESMTITSDRSFTLGYSYDTQGSLSSITYPDGDVVSFAPNGLGQPTKASLAARTGRAAYNYATNATYYPTGSINTFTYGNGLTHKTTLNTRNLPSDIKDYKTGSDVLNYSYEYDNNLNVTKLTDNTNDTYSLTSLTYDGLNRLETVTGKANIGSSSISYDALGNIRTYTSKDRELNYHYDASATPGRSNLLTSVDFGFTNPINYKSFQYDDRGNVTDNGLMSFTYNLANQMVSAGGGKAFLYDGHNRRVKKTTNDDTSYSLYSQSGTLLYRETDYGSINYIYLGGKLIAKDGFIPENAGKQHFRPYGESIEGEINDAGYTGHKFDTDLGLSYMQARYYDPVIGRFYSNDPVDAMGHTQLGNSIAHGFNRYAYANNNPYKFIDPTGMSGECVNGTCGESDKYPNGNEYQELIESKLTDNQIQAYNEAQNQVLKNKVVGKSAEEMAAEHVKKNHPDAEVGIGGVTLKVEGNIRYPDLTVKHSDGTIEFIEVKANLGIPTKKQITRDRIIQSGGASVKTSKHSFLPIGLIGPTNVDLINVKVPVN